MRAMTPWTIVFFLAGLVFGIFWGSYALLFAGIGIIGCILVAFFAGPYGPTMAFLYGIDVLTYTVGALLGSGLFGHFFVWLGHLIS